MSATTTRDALESATGAIEAAGCETPRLDAEVLLAHVLGIERSRLFTDTDLTVQGQAVRAFQTAVRRRAIDREPVAYITGVRGFRNIELRVDSRALIPRPETELLVEYALSFENETRVLDLCTGSGAVALALKQERPDLEIWGSDISEQALELAAENGARLGLGVSWRQSDLLQALDHEFDAILCNPPYVGEHERTMLAPEILRHEPPLALFSGVDGLLLISGLMEQISDRPEVKRLAIEIGHGQAQSVAQLIRAAGFQVVRIEPDLAGIERVVIGER